MQAPESWLRLLDHLARGIPDDPAIMAASSLLEKKALLALGTTRDDEFEHEVALVALYRALLAVIPVAVLEDPRLACKPAVTSRLRHLLGREPDAEMVRTLTRVVRRMQRYRSGRKASSFDRWDPLHLERLRSQGGRCAGCGFEFGAAELEADASSDARPTVGSPLNDMDRSPLRLRRRAVLDHIYPVYLAGDRLENLQVLCATCNTGKSDMIFGLESRAWFGGARVSDLIRATPQVFYMTLRRDRRCAHCGRTPMQTELRIARRDQFGASLYPNLQAVCVECIEKLRDVRPKTRS